MMFCSLWFEQIYDDMFTFLNIYIYMYIYIYIYI